MRTKVINDVLIRLGDNFSEEHLSQVKQALIIVLANYDITEIKQELVVYEEDANLKLLRLFLISKKIEGCTDKTLQYYQLILRKFLPTVNKPVTNISADDIRLYIAQKSIQKKITKVTQDNELRIIKSFFTWLSVEEHIPKNPTLKIKHIKQEKRIKKPFSEIEIEKLRNGAKDLRERAIIELLLSTGMRVGEIVGINRRDIEGDQVVVYGKGEKERYVYLNAKAIVSIEDYLKSRNDNNEALFVSYREPHNRLSIASFGSILRDLGRELSINNVHPHRFRRTAATLALNRGMPIEQVQKMLGHDEITTTLIYAQVAQDSVRQSHRKFLS